MTNDAVGSGSSSGSQQSAVSLRIASADKSAVAVAGSVAVVAVGRKQ